MARLYVTDYITYNTITEAKYATWQVASDSNFTNIIAETFKDPVNVLSWYTSLNNTVYKELETGYIKEVFGRVKLYTDNSESPWYVLKLDRSRHDRFYYASNFLRERIWNREGELIVDQEFNESDNPIDVWFYDLLFMDDFFEGYLNTKDWEISEYIDESTNVRYSNNFFDVYDDKFGLIRIGCKKDSDGLMGTKLNYKHDIEFRNGTYIETRVDFPIMDNAELKVNLKGNNLDINLVAYNPKLKRFNSEISYKGFSVFSKTLTTGYYTIFGVLLENNILKIYMNHKLIGEIKNIEEDDLKLSYIATPSPDINNEAAMDIDYIKIYMRNPDYQIPEAAKLDPLKLY